MRRRTMLKGSTATLLAGLIPQVAPAQTGLSFSYGWDPEVEAPTEASFYVAPGGDDAADGSLARPFRTLQRGVDALARQQGGSLAIRSGLYREKVTFTALQGTPDRRFRIHRYGRERVTITAADPLTGWQPVTADEAAALGIPADGVHVARLRKSSLEHGAPQALNLHEAGVWRPLAVDRADMSNPETSGDQATYHRGQYGVDDDNNILALRDARLIGRTAEQLREVRVLLYHRPNIITAIDIDRFDPASGTIVLADQSKQVHIFREQPVMRYALQNDPLAMTPGTWIARTTGEDEISVYLRGEAPADVEVSSREYCVEFGEARHTELFGIEAVRAAGMIRHRGRCIGRTARTPDGDPTFHGLSIRHCRVGESMAAGDRGYGPLFITRARGVTLRNVSIGPARGSFGMFLAGVDQADIRYLHIQNVSNSAARFFTLTNAVLAFSLFEDSAWDAHANKFNFYEGCDAVLVYGVRTRRVQGYATYQKASRINFAFCELNVDPGSNNRALVSQNRRDGAGEPLQNTTFYYWNNTLLADRTQQDPANSLQLGPADTTHTHVVYNNILHGGGFGGDNLGTRAPRSHNRYTGLSFWQAAHRGWEFAEAEQEIRPGMDPGPLGRDMRPFIARDLAPLFPGFTDWNVDIDGTPVNWDAAPIGATV